ncbi:MAG: Fic family protein [Microthrixaceae bacterium]
MADGSVPRGRLSSRTWQPDSWGYAPPKHRRPCRYETFSPDPILAISLHLPGEVAGLVADAEAAVGALNAHARPALQPLAQLLLRTESIASSKVEGLQVNARSLATAEARGESGRSPGPEVAEVLANVDAMALAIERGSTSTRLTVDDLTAVHGELMATTKPAIAGQVRTVQNWIGGNDYTPCKADFVPPPPEEVGGLLDDLCQFCESEDLPVLVQAAIAHAQFETIHPFEDGNGRTGRALIHILLRRRGLAPEYVPPVSVILARNRQGYISGLKDFRDGELTSWIAEFATAVARSAVLADRFLEQVQDLQLRWRDQVAGAMTLRADAAAWSIINVLPAHPVITTQVAVAATSRSKSKVTIAIDNLVEAGVLSPLTQGRRNRAWEAVGLLDLLTEMDEKG